MVGFKLPSYQLFTTSSELKEIVRAYEEAYRTYRNNTPAWTLRKNVWMPFRKFELQFIQNKINSIKPLTNWNAWIYHESVEPQKTEKIPFISDFTNFSMKFSLTQDEMKVAKSFREKNPSFSLQKTDMEITQLIKEIQHNKISIVRVKHPVAEFIQFRNFPKEDKHLSFFEKQQKWIKTHPQPINLEHVIYASLKFSRNGKFEKNPELSSCTIQNNQFHWDNF